MAGATFGTDAPRRRRTSHTELSEKRPLFGFLPKNLSEITNFLLQALGRLPKDRAWHDHGPFVYRLGRQVFNLERGVRFPYGLPSPYFLFYFQLLKKVRGKLGELYFELCDFQPNNCIDNSTNFSGHKSLR
jgi:hypothetical protein